MNEQTSIIIVDDDPIFPETLSSYLSGEGFVCAVAGEAETALRRLSERQYDIMLTDIVLPGMQGLELMERAKRICPSMSGIVMTGHIDEFSYDDAIASGASDFIRKPFSLNELAMRIKHVRLQEKMRMMSITDEMTGLPNRRGFFAFAEQQIKSAIRARKNMVVVFADMDNFKDINDTWGHLVGDGAISAMADVFRKCYRDSDIIARMGGDEFAVLLIDTADRDMQAITDRLETILNQANAGLDNKYRLSVSMGMAVFDHTQPATIDELLQEADRRMYEEKQRKKLGVVAR